MLESSIVNTALVILRRGHSGSIQKTTSQTSKKHVVFCFVQKSYLLHTAPFFILAFFQDCVVVFSLFFSSTHPRLLPHDVCLLSCAPQKLFNTKQALVSLERDGVVASSAAAAVTAKDVVDGNRDATLRLLWAIIAHYSFCALLNRDALAGEVEGVVNAARKWRRAGFSPARPGRGVCGGGMGETGVGGNGEFSSPLRNASPGEAVSPPSGGRAVAGWEHPPLAMPDVAELRAGWGEGGGDDKELLAALLAWCQAVCHGYGVPVRNFTTSFADGRALCLLLHYYHPRVSFVGAGMAVSGGNGGGEGGSLGGNFALVRRPSEGEAEVGGWQGGEVGDCLERGGGVVQSSRR